MGYLERLAEGKTENSSDNAAVPFPPIAVHNLTDFLGMKIPPRNLLLSPWLPEKGTAMICAERGIGKTFLGLSVAYAVAVGGSFLGFSAPTPRKVLYIDGEMSAIELQTRLRVIAKGFPQSLPDPSFFRMASADLQEIGLPDMASADGLKVINTIVGDADLIVLDNLSTLVRGGQENEADSWVTTQDWVLAQKRAGRSVLLIHHANKSGGQRGTSKKEDILDASIMLEYPCDYKRSEGSRFNVRYTKARSFYGEAAEPFEAKFQVVNGDVGTWTRSAVVLPTDKANAAILETLGLSVREAEKATGLPRNTISRRRRKMKAKPDLAKSLDMNAVPVSQTLGDGTVGHFVTTDEGLEGLLAEAVAAQKPPEQPDAP